MPLRTESPYVYPSHPVARMKATGREGHLQAQQVDVEDANLQRKIEINTTIHEAGVPLAILGSAWVVDTLQQQISSTSIAERVTQLLPRKRRSGDAQTVQARWLEAPGHAWQRPDGADAVRQLAVLEWVLGRLLKKVKPALLALPAGAPLQVRLHIETQVAEAEIRTCWQSAWQQEVGSTRAPAPTIQADLPALAAAEGWLESGEHPDQAPLILLVVVKLAALQEQLPASGTAEAATVLLLAGTGIVRQSGLRPVAALHRPERRMPDRLEHGLRHALCWSGLTGETILHQWLTGGAQSAAQRALLSACAPFPIGVKTTPGLLGLHDLDWALGNMSTAGEWLTVALATEHVGVSGEPQLVSPETDGQITLAVVAPF
ncbi:hypothetical protein HNQ50_002121 [Silvimonas terrae]|uniref:Uncharacterized protein n=1 Tax=Silvimonas terrae TaxID=300266 RepID=A0A840RGP2_9NEIS|nr:hypothetical protein [Silvimonas terrae]MBB5191391.1 hypothetical protein [Silvimonas terrae]